MKLNNLFHSQHLETCLHDQYGRFWSTVKEPVHISDTKVTLQIPLTISGWKILPDREPSSVCSVNFLHVT